MLKTFTHRKVKNDLKSRNSLEKQCDLSLKARQIWPSCPTEEIRVLHLSPATLWNLYADTGDAQKHIYEEMNQIQFIMFNTPAGFSPEETADISEKVLHKRWKVQQNAG